MTSSSWAYAFPADVMGEDTVDPDAPSSWFAGSAWRRMKQMRRASSGFSTVWCSPDSAAPKILTALWLSPIARWEARAREDDAGQPARAHRRAPGQTGCRVDGASLVQDRPGIGWRLQNSACLSALQNRRRPVVETTRQIEQGSPRWAPADDRPPRPRIRQGGLFPHAGRTTARRRRGARSVRPAQTPQAQLFHHPAMTR